MALKDFLQPEFYVGRNLAEDFKCFWSEKLSHFRDLQVPYEKDDGKLGARTMKNDAFSIVVALTLVPYFIGGRFIKSLAQVVVGLFTLPYFASKKSFKEAAGWLGNNAGQFLLNALILLTIPYDILAMTFIRLPIKGISTLISNLKSKQAEKDTNTFEHSPQKNSATKTASVQKPSLKPDASDEHTSSSEKSPSHDSDDLSDNDVLRLSGQ